MEGDDGRIRSDGDGGGGAAAGVGGRVTVLVVDDSPVDRKLVERLLLRSDDAFEVIAVDSGKKALDFLGWNGEHEDSGDANGQKIDIILTDYCMPGMDGYELLKVVKDHKHLRPIPVVVMSSENVPQRISRCRAVGANDFILKPLQKIDMQRLRNYAQLPVPSATNMSSKRKLSLDEITDNKESQRRDRPRRAGVTVA